YTLVKTLSGFGLPKDAVKFVAMDAPTIYSSFLAGEGDACVLAGASGAFNMLNLADEYVPISNGSWAKAGLITNFVANKNSYKDETKYTAMKKFLEVYFKATDWVSKNNEEAGQYMLDFCEENGVKSDLETCKKLLKADEYYTIDQAYEMITKKAEGQEYSDMEGRLLDVLKFFVEAGSYKEEDKATFMNHTDAKLLTEIYNASK
ncbi:MAG: ABC transporter substrate-binding protein, partial [Hungatella sp.]